MIIKMRKNTRVANRISLKTALISKIAGIKSKRRKRKRTKVTNNRKDRLTKRVKKKIYQYQVNLYPLMVNKNQAHSLLDLMTILKGIK